MNGVIIIDKPAGKTSFDIIRDVRKILNIRKVGHTGTLDPLATGVLPVCVNEATKLVQFFSQDNKEYLVTMLLGIETDTFDLEGQVVARCTPHVTPTDITTAIEGFTGTIAQTPPRYSAIKFKGKALYKWTRQGIDIEPPVRTVEIYSLRLINVALPYVTLAVSCSKGTYIRSLCADIGHELGCGACVSSLRRTESGCFQEGAALSLGGVDEQDKQRVLKQNLIPIVDTLPDFAAVAVDGPMAQKIRQGYQPEITLLQDNDIPSLSKGDLVKFITSDNELIAVAEMLVDSRNAALYDERMRCVKILRVFNGRK